MGPLLLLLPLGIPLSPHIFPPSTPTPQSPTVPPHPWVLSCWTPSHTAPSLWRRCPSPWPRHTLTLTAAASPTLADIMRMWRLAVRFTTSATRMASKTLSSAGTGQSSTSISGHATSRAAFIVLPVTDLLQHQLRTTPPPHTHLPLWCTMLLLCTMLPLHHMCTLAHTQAHHTHHSQPHT